MLTEYLLVNDVPGEAEEFIRGCLPKRVTAPEGARDAQVDPVEQILRDLNAPNTSAWVAKADGQIEAIFGAQLRHITAADPEYTYMPARYALISLSGWHVASADGWAYAPGLLDHIARDAREDGIDRLSIDIPVDDATAVRTLLDNGFEPDVILAGMPTRPGSRTQPTEVVIRRARDEDAAALLALTVEEAEYHAWNTNTGTQANQHLEPSQKLVQTWLDNQRRHDLPTFVAEREGQVVGMVPLMFIDDDAADHEKIPADYGYVGSTSVTSSARSAGVGTALVERVVDAAYSRGMRVLLVHFVADNVLSAPFWARRGFTPVTVTMTRRREIAHLSPSSL